MLSTVHSRVYSKVMGKLPEVFNFMWLNRKPNRFICNYRLLLPSIDLRHTIHVELTVGSVGSAGVSGRFFSKIDQNPSVFMLRLLPTYDYT